MATYRTARKFGVPSDSMVGAPRVHHSCNSGSREEIRKSVLRITHYQAMLLNPERIQFGTVTSLNRTTLLPKGEAEAAVEHNCLVGLMVEED
ncbi:hypothetical protein STEG23_004532 [Scotinomys teguina]